MGDKQIDDKPIYTKKQFWIIICLYQNDCTNTFKSYTRKKLKDSIKLDDNTGLSMNTIIKTTDLFVDEGFIAKGSPDGQAQTYYLTQKGIDEYEKLLGKK